eukprot:SAG22_NODE_12725_length_431_cov_1.548193_1_plen_82_part_10
MSRTCSSDGSQDQSVLTPVDAIKKACQNFSPHVEAEMEHDPQHVVPLPPNSTTNHSSTANSTTNHSSTANSSLGPSGGGRNG